MKNTIMSVKLLDTTLRDGEQRPGVSFTRQDKVTLARGLDAWGIPILEIGIPAMGRAERQTLDVLHGLGLGAELLVWNRLAEADLELCLAAGYPSLHFSVPVSPVMIRSKLAKDEAWVLGQVERIVSRAVAVGRQVSLGAEDGSRADPAFVAQVFARAVDAGASRVRFADTLGLMTPSSVAAVVGPLAEGLSVPLDFHGHDDFGLAAANTVAAAEVGAGVLSCSLLGMGERAGNAALEEVTAILDFLRCPGSPQAAGRRQRFSELTDLCRKAAALAGQVVPEHKALVGPQVFTHESGIHVDGLLKDPATYEAWPPEVFGGRRRLRFGKHSGTAALRYLASLQGVEVGGPEAGAFLEDLRESMGEKPGINPEAELAALLAAREARR